jgi:lipopolysaccharide biosynthesis regulator YciM
MPLNVRRFCTSVILTIGAAALPAAAQTPEQQQSQTPPPAAAQIIAAKPPTSAEVMRERISKAKAFIAVRNYNAAIYELENIRRETADPSVLSVSNVLLMNSFLEQGNYKRAQDFLTETYNAQKANKPDAAVNFTIVAGQVIKSARSQVERYRSLGLTVSDRTLPLEAERH